MFEQERKMHFAVRKKRELMGRKKMRRLFVLNYPLLTYFLTTKFSSRML